MEESRCCEEAALAFLQFAVLVSKEDFQNKKGKDPFLIWVQKHFILFNQVFQKCWKTDKIEFLSLVV